MSRYFDDELAHSGVKGMKWRKHKYRLVKDANGKLRYVYDNDNTGTGVKSSKGQMFRQARAEEKDNVKKLSSEYLQKKRIVSSAKPMTETDYKVTNFNIDKDGKVDYKIRKVVRTGRSGEEKQAREKRAAESAKKERARRIRRAEANKEQIERRKRIRQAEANKEQVERRKIKAQHVANNQKAKATGKRAEWAVDKPYQSKVEYDQAHQSFMLKERNRLNKQGDRSSFGYKDKDKSISQMHDALYKRQQRQARRLTEGFSPESKWSNSPTLAGPGHRARAAESTARHKAAVNAQRKSKEHTARTEEATARRKAATNKYVGEHSAQQYRIRKTQEAVAEKRKKADDWRKANPSIESLGYSSNPYDTRATGHYNKGDSDRFRNVPDFRYEPSKETKKRLRRNKRKKAVADTKRAIDKGRKAVEEFFTPKKKKKR